MKKIIKYIPALLAASLVCMSCKQTFLELNTDRQGVTPEMAERDGVAAGGFIQDMERNILPVGTSANKTDIINSYQIAYHIGPDVWSGYFAENANWIGGINHTTYSLVQGWINASFKASYTNSFTSWLTLKNITAKSGAKEVYALAQILKISAWHKATDFFGPIPYTKAGTGLFVTPYDSQEVVYKAMLSDLQAAIDVVKKYNMDGGQLLPAYDLIYNGNTGRWLKYANSLMLRLAMRIRYADPVDAKKYAELAVANGVMTQKEDGASISRAQGLQFDNPIYTFAEQYGECRMGSPAFSYLVGYKDPRLEKYYQTSNSPIAIDVQGQKYLPIPTGLGIKSDTYSACSKPNIIKTTPVHLLLTSEVYFLRAEGALIGWNMGGTTEDLYKDGVKMSFAENDIDVSKANQYLMSEATPSDIDLSNMPNFNSVYKAPTNISPKFEGTDEVKLEKIITQKWIALYPNGMEAWTEWRRTGYPKIFPIRNNRSGGVVDSRLGIRRLNYYKGNNTNGEQLEVYNDAVKLLGGPDSPATNLWWDKKVTK